MSCVILAARGASDVPGGPSCENRRRRALSRVGASSGSPTHAVGERAAAATYAEVESQPPVSPRTSLTSTRRIFITLNSRLVEVKTSTSESLRRAGGDAGRESASLQPARRDPRSHRRATRVRTAARSPAVHPIEVPPRTLKPARRGAHLQQLSPRRPPRPPAGRRVGRTARPTVSQRLDVRSTSSGPSRRCRGHRGLPARRRSRRPRATKQVRRTSPWPAETMGRRGRRRGRP